MGDKHRKIITPTNYTSVAYEDIVRKGKQMPETQESLITTYDDSKHMK